MHFLCTHQQEKDEAERKRFPFGRQPTVRPPAKAFNAEEARQLGLYVSRMPGPDGQSYLMVGSHRFIDGYVERDVAIKVGMVRGWLHVKSLDAQY